MGRQFLSLLSQFLLIELLLYVNDLWTEGEGDLHILQKHTGIMSIFIVVPLFKALPEIIAIEFPLQVMSMYSSYGIVWLCMVINNVFGVGHAAYSIYMALQACRWQGWTVDMTKGKQLKPVEMTMESRELYLKSGEATGDN